VVRGVNRGVMVINSHDSSRSDPGVVTNDIGGVGDTLADLVALGGDHLLAVLNGGDINVLSTHSAGHASGSVCWYLLALLDRDGVTDWLGDLGRSLSDLGRSSMTSMSNMGSNEGWRMGGLSLRLGLSLALVMGGESHHSLGHPQGSVVGGTVGHSDGGSGSYTCGHHLALMPHHLPGQDGLGGGLLAGGGDDLLAVLGVHSVHYLVVLLVADLPWCLHLPGGALQLGDGVTLGG